ncbi:MAG TPA: hypothetical protein DCY91_00970 [Cyanobacteria bacterium UBA11370]|nr:hypothetical protein [Cyanobacteria bacterium UBA11370]
MNPFYTLVVHVINYGGCRDVALQRLYWISFITINSPSLRDATRSLILEFKHQQLLEYPMSLQELQEQIHQLSVSDRLALVNAIWL